MMYLWPSGGSMEGMHEQFGVMVTPAMRGISAAVLEGRKWAGDNEAFTRQFDPERFFGYYELLKPWKETCLFIACPDIVGNATATVERYREWARLIKRQGFPVAFCAQDGQEHLELPVAFDWLFVGGTTEWKMSEAADDCIRRAKAIGKPVHVGRVNSLKRMAHFKLMEVDTVDGTSPIYKPDTARKRLEKGFVQPALISLL